VACHILGVNAFDQPNVEAAKKRAKARIAAYQESGQLEAGEFVSLQEAKPALEEFLGSFRVGDYIAMMGFLPRNSEMFAVLQDLRLAIRNKTKHVVTLGFGPRFLHSTGQLHKGDAGKGLFIQLTGDMPRDAAIPDEAGEPDSSISFGTLKMAQALGDRQALLDAGRRVIRFDLGLDVPGGIKRLSEALLLTTRSASAKSGARR
jgi:hypothetical protein